MGYLGGCVFLQVAEVHEGGMNRPHRKVYVLGLQDRGICGQASRVADVSEVDLDGVGIGGRSFA